MKFIKNPCSIATVVKFYVIRNLFLFYLLFFIFCFGGTLIIATEHHSDVEIEPISNDSPAHLKNFNCRLTRSTVIFPICLLC